MPAVCIALPPRHLLLCSLSRQRFAITLAIIKKIILGGEEIGEKTEERVKGAAINI